MYVNINKKIFDLKNIILNALLILTHFYFFTVEEVGVDGHPDKKIKKLINKNDFILLLTTYIQCYSESSNCQKKNFL